MTDDEFPLPAGVRAHHKSLLSGHIDAKTRRAYGGGKRRARTAALCAGLLIGVLLLVAPAFGIGGRVLDLVRGQPAPSEVQTYFAYSSSAHAQLVASARQAGLELQDQFSPVLASQARGVFAITSPDGPIFLWAAPTADGRQCWLLQTAYPALRGTGSCDGPHEQRPMRPEILWSENRPSVQIVSARIYEGAITHVDLTVEGAEPTSLPVRSGYALGTLPKDARVLALRGMNDEGQEVARQTVR